LLAQDIKIPVIGANFVKDSEFGLLHGRLDRELSASELVAECLL
jgi:hypothetical protein